MIILPNATRKLDMIKDAKDRLKEWSVNKLLGALNERGIVHHLSIEKDELIDIVICLGVIV
ncbi:2528_t:CDS:1 [Acaulospora morrowiae]|uniref:2528_t:CDS:1 n=1 Tax=Acaulospora morrowiae TaxID=94023 RepID=A0A9N9JF31_9GLOM|nr:2528_t:CDS:1 [Acaulospora morrowiae]